MINFTEPLNLLKLNKPYVTVKTAVFEKKSNFLTYDLPVWFQLKINILFLCFWIKLLVHIILIKINRSKTLLFLVALYVDTIYFKSYCSLFILVFLKTMTNVDTKNLKH